MKRTERLAGKFGILLCGALLGYTTYGQPSVAVGVIVPAPSVVVVTSVEIHTESDFYVPLASDGEWVVVGHYGRCWRPAHVDRDWRPYSEGYWQSTDAGWYWVSDEPWAWATYHYGRWDFTDEYGWYWVPQTEWAPSWVSWHSGGGYVGWAPLYPAGVIVISPRAYVFVEERHFMEPVRRSKLIVNNTAIIKQAARHENPAAAAIEKASGRKIQSVPVQELRHKTEAAAASKQRTPAATSDKKVLKPAPDTTEPRGKKNSATPEPTKVEKPAANHESAVPDSKNRETQSEKQKSVHAAPELKPEAKPEIKPEVKPEVKHAPVIQEPAQPKADKHIEQQQEQSSAPSGRQEQQPAREKPGGSEKSGKNPSDKDREDKPKE